MSEKFDEAWETQVAENPDVCWESSVENLDGSKLYSTRAGEDWVVIHLAQLHVKINTSQHGY